MGKLQRVIIRSHTELKEDEVGAELCDGCSWCAWIEGVADHRLRGKGNTPDEALASLKAILAHYGALRFVLDEIAACNAATTHGARGFYCSVCGEESPARAYYCDETGAVFCSADGCKNKEGGAWDYVKNEEQKS